MKANLLTVLFIGALLAVSCAKEEQLPAPAPAPANAVRINNLWWSTMNVGATTPQAYGNYYTFQQAQTACPSGWRLPSKDELVALDGAGRGAWTTYNGVNGRWFGPNPGNASTSIFFPAAGLNGGSAGAGGYYWSSTEYNSSDGYYLLFNSSTVNPENYNLKTYDTSVRCVQ